MIPSGLFSLVVFLACVAPGYIHVLVANSQQPRPHRTPFGEFAETMIVGSVTSVLCGGIVLTATGLLGLLDPGRALTDLRPYFDDYPLPVLVTALAALGLSFALAAFSARKMYPGPEHAGSEGGPGFREGASGWLTVLWTVRPHTKPVVGAVVTLEDGSRVYGTVGGFETEHSDNREIHLRAPISVQQGSGKPIRGVPWDFVVLRENKMRYVAGKYYAEKATGARILARRSLP